MPADPKRYYGLVLGFVGTVFAANWTLDHFGFVSVGFGLDAPAGVYWAGLAFTLRDLVQRTLGRRWVVAAIVAGALASALVDLDLAKASGVAFLVSELADFAVYTPLAERRFLLAVILSNTVGAVIDSLLFLWLAFGSIDFWQGQVVGKSWVTVATALTIVAIKGFHARSRI